MKQVIVETCGIAPELINSLNVDNTHQSAMKPAIMLSNNLLCFSKVYQVGIKPRCVATAVYWFGAVPQSLICVITAVRLSVSQ